MKARIKLGVVLALSLGLAAVVMLGLPLLYLTLPNPTPVPVASIAEAGRGIYLVADGRTLRLFPRSSAAGTLPQGSAVAHSVESVVVAARQPGDEPSYRLRRLDGEPAEATVALDREGPLTLVRITPATLADGDYEVAFPRESIYGGEDYAYFSVSR